MKVLFVCEGNVNRSQTASMFLKNLRPDIEVSSAGTMMPLEREGKLVSSIHLEGIEAMKEIGLDMSKNTMHVLTPAMVEDADKIVLVGPTTGGPLPQYLKNSAKLETWDVPDPGYGHISVRAARDMVRERVARLSEALEH